MVSMMAFVTVFMASIVPDRPGPFPQPGLFLPVAFVPHLMTPTLHETALGHSDWPAGTTVLADPCERVDRGVDPVRTNGNVLFPHYGARTERADRFC